MFGTQRFEAALGRIQMLYLDRGSAGQSSALA